MLQYSGERQVSTTLEGVRSDHTGRYQWAAERIDANAMVLDAGCGIGYGSSILAGRCQGVFAIDRSEDTIAYAQRYWSRDNIEFSVGDLSVLDADSWSPYDAVVAFEVLEHLIEPALFLRSAWSVLAPAGKLFVSAPNERRVPHKVDQNPFHIRHFTEKELVNLLTAEGFDVVFHGGQEEGPEVLEGDAGRFHVVEAVKREGFCPGSRAEVLEQALCVAAGAIVTRAELLKASNEVLKASKQKISRLSEEIKEMKGKEASAVRQTSAAGDSLSLIGPLLDRFKAQSDSHVEDLRDRAKASERECREAQISLQETTERLQSAREAALRAEAELDFEKVRLGREVDRLAAELNRTEANADRLEADLKSEIQEKKRFAEQAGDLEAQLGVLRQDCAELRVAAEDIASRLAMVSGERDRARQAERHLADDNARLSSDNARLLSENDKLSLEMKAMAGKLKSAVLQASPEVKTDRKLKDKYIALESRVADLLMKIRALTAERDRHASLNEGLVAKLASREGEIRSAGRKEPPSLGYIYRKAASHKMYVPFIYRAVRNSLGLKRRKQSHSKAKKG